MERLTPRYVSASPKNVSRPAKLMVLNPGLSALSNGLVRAVVGSLAVCPAQDLLMASSRPLAELAERRPSPLQGARDDLLGPVLILTPTTSRGRSMIEGCDPGRRCVAISCFGLAGRRNRSWRLTVRRAKSAPQREVLSVAARVARLRRSSAHGGMADMGEARSAVTAARPWDASAPPRWRMKRPNLVHSFEGRSVARTALWRALATTAPMCKHVGVTGR